MGDGQVSITDTKLRESIDTVLRTEAGRRMFAYLFQLCGYNVSSLVRKPDGEVAPLSTECREAQRLVYIRLRNLASYELLAAAEEMAERPIPASVPASKEK